MKDKLYNRKTDVWSYGVVIYEILTAKIPYAGVVSTEAAVGIMMNNLSLIPEIEQNASVYPAILVHLVKVCLQFDPDARPSFKDIVQMLE